MLFNVWLVGMPMCVLACWRCCLPTLHTLPRLLHAHMTGKPAQREAVAYARTPHASQWLYCAGAHNKISLDAADHHFEVYSDKTLKVRGADV